MKMNAKDILSIKNIEKMEQLEVVL